MHLTAAAALRAPCKIVDGPSHGDTCIGLDVLRSDFVHPVRQISKPQPDWVLSEKLRAGD